MDVDLATTVAPFLAAAAGTYGAAVLDKVRDATADATADAAVGAGRRLLRRFLAREDGGGPVAEAVVELAADPGDADRVAALRLQVRKALAADPELATEVAHLVASAGVFVSASGDGAVAVQHNSGVIQTGAHSQVRPERR